MAARGSRSLAGMTTKGAKARQRQKQRQQQIPFGDDNQKGNGNGNGNYNGNGKDIGDGKKQRPGQCPGLCWWVGSD